MLSRDNIISYFKTINTTTVDDNFLNYCIDETIDRISIYLNIEVDDLPEKLERIVASVVNNVFKQYNANKNNVDVDTQIASMSDNGQSVAFRDSVTNYFASTTDKELFQGYTPLLNRYRRASVVI